MSNASRGHALERRARAELRAASYVAVRVRGSLGPVDVVALPRFPLTGQPLLVQVKGGPRPMSNFSPADWNEVFYLARDTNAIPLLCTHPKRGLRLTWQRLAAAKHRPGAASPLAPFTLALVTELEDDPEGDQ